MDWIPIKPSEHDRAFMDFQEAIRKQITEIYKLDLDEMGATLKPAKPKHHGETFEVKPHFTWTPFRRSVTECAILDDKLKIIVHDYRQWREGQIKKEVINGATALFITGHANVDVRNIFREAGGNGKISYVEMCELRRRYIEDMYGVPVHWIPGHEPKEEEAA